MKIKMLSNILTPRLTFLSKLKEPLHLEMEREISEWFAQMPDIKIHHLKQTMPGDSWVPGKLIVSIWYE